MKKGRKKRGRANGHGTLERGASGVYLARWMANGKRHSRSTGTHDLRDAEKRLEEFTATFRLENEQRTLETLTGRIEGVKAEIREWKERRPALRLVDAFEAYRASTARPDAGARTLSGYESYFNRFLEWMKKNRPEAERPEGEETEPNEKTSNYSVEVRAVTAADAEAYAAHVIDRLSAGTFNKHLIFLRCMWRVLMDGDDGKSDDADRPEKLKAKIIENPWARIHKRKHTPHARRELTVDELGAVIGAAAGEMRLLLALGIYTGLRLGDCALLEWGSVDLVRRLVSVVPRKTARRTGKRVTVPLHEVLEDMLLEVPEKRRRGYVLPETAKDYRRDSALVANRVKALFEGCGIKTGHADERTGRAVVDVGFHSLRHTFVSLSANGGAPMAAVQSIVGHGSPAMTRHYYHENESALRRVVSALPDVANGEKGDKRAEKDRLADFRAMVDAMDSGDLAKAARYLDEVRRRKECAKNKRHGKK